MVASLWGEVFEQKDTSSEVQSVLKKLQNPKTTEVSVEKILKSKKTSLKDKLLLINENVQKILGVYKEKTVVIHTREQLRDYIDAAVKNGIIAIDTETNNSLDPLTCKLMGPCIYTPGQKNAYIPINHFDPDTNERLPNQVTEQDIREEFERLGDTKVLTHNGTFDYQVVKCTTGYTMHVYWDTMVGARMLDENERAGLKIQYITKIDPSIEKYSIDHLFKDVPYGAVDPDIFALYAATDAYMTYMLYQYQVKQFENPDLKRLFYVFREIEMPLIEIVAEMEMRGVYINQDYAKRLQDKYAKKSEEVEAAIAKEVEGYAKQIAEWRLTPEANVKPPKKTGDGLGNSKSELLQDPPSTSSPLQLAILLYDVLKVKSVDKENPRSTGEAALKAIDLPLCKLMLEKRGIDKLRSVFIDKLPAAVNPTDHRLHAHFNQNGTDCVVGNTPILTPQGVIPIKEIVGECLDADYKEFQYPLVNELHEEEMTSHKIMFSQAPTKKITTAYGLKLEGTLNHPIRVLNRNIKDFAKNKSAKVMRDLWTDIQWRQLGKLAEGDLVLVDIHPYSNNNSYIATDFDQNIVGQTHKSRSSKMPDYINESFAEFMGMYEADGSLRSRSDSWGVSLHNEDPVVVSRWTALCQELFDLTPYHETAGEGRVGCWSIRGKKLSQLQKYLMCGKRNKRVPAEIFRSSDKVFNAFIKGLLLDSGHGRKGRPDTLFITVLDEYDARAIQQRLFAQGIFCGINSTSIKSGREWGVYIFGEFLTRFESLVGVSYNLNIRKHTRLYRHDDWVAVSITGILDGVADVYDFTLPKTHSFISGGLISHNTGRFSSSDPNL